MKCCITTEDIKSLGTILSVWAHPDDESFMCGGIMATAVQNGQRVVCITATKGEAGSHDEQRWPPATIGKVRAKEMAAGLQVLGVREHHWLGYTDGCCAAAPATKAVAAIQRIAEEVHPDTILTFGPDGWTGHPDHATVSNWAATVRQKLNPRPRLFQAVVCDHLYEQYLKAADEQVNIFFNIDEPPLRQPQDCAIHFQLQDEVVQRKFDALRAMPSQTEVLFELFDLDMLYKAFGIEAFEEVRGEEV